MALVRQANLIMLQTSWCLVQYKNAASTCLSSEYVPSSSPSIIWSLCLSLESLKFLKNFTKEIVFFPFFFLFYLKLWWVCVCRSKRVSGTDNSLTSSGIIPRVSSFTLLVHSTRFPDAFSKGVLIPTCSQRSEIAITLVASRPEDAFIDLSANSILVATMLSIAVKNAFWILHSTVSTMFRRFSPSPHFHWWLDCY